MTPINNLNPSNLIAGIRKAPTPAAPEPSAPQPTEFAQPSGIFQATPQSEANRNQPTMQPNLLIGNSPVANEDESKLNTMRFINIRYRIYFAIIAVILLIIYPTVMETYTQHQSSKTEVSTMDTRIESNINKQNRFATDQSFILDIEKSETDLLSCINLETSCDQLPAQLANQVSTIKNYLQLGTLETDKMKIDEKKILRNINEFLLQENPFSTDKTYNGELHSISIGENRQKKEHLWEAPIELGITFATKEDVLNFLGHIEKHIFENPAYGLDNTILYKIENISYDIMNYEEVQDVTISLLAYYYK